MCAIVVHVSWARRETWSSGTAQGTHKVQLWSAELEYRLTHRYQEGSFAFCPCTLETWMGFCVGSGLRGKLWSTQVQPEVGTEDLISVGQLYENICNKSQFNFCFSCAFSLWICWSLLMKCLDPHTCRACWVLANSVHGCVCMDLGVPAVPRPWSSSEAVLGWWHDASVWALGSPPRWKKGLPRELTHAQIFLPPWVWEWQEPS